MTGTVSVAGLILIFWKTRRGILRKAAVSDIFAENLQQNIEKVLSTDHIKYSELKIGADKKTGRGLKWELEEIRKGSKLLKGQEENVSERISP